MDEKDDPNIESSFPELVKPYRSTLLELQGESMLYDGTTNDEKPTEEKKANPYYDFLQEGDVLFTQWEKNYRYGIYIGHGKVILARPMQSGSKSYKIEEESIEKFALASQKIIIDPQGAHEKTPYGPKERAVRAKRSLEKHWGTWGDTNPNYTFVLWVCYNQGPKDRLLQKDKITCIENRDSQNSVTNNLKKIVTTAITAITSSVSPANTATDPSQEAFTKKHAYTIAGVVTGYTLGGPPGSVIGLLAGMYLDNK